LGEIHVSLTNGARLAEIAECQHHTQLQQTILLTRTVIGIQAGNAKCGLPPIFNGQSLVNTPTNTTDNAVVVPVIA
jgi:hypothetical protein